MDLDLDAVMRSLAGARTLEQLVRPLLDLLQGASGYDSVYMTHVDAARNAQRIVFARNAGALEIAEGREGRWDRSLCQRALAQGVGHVEDATVCWPDLEVARNLGIRSFATVPITLGDGEPLGTLCCASHDLRPDDADARRLLRLFAFLIGQHIERERLLTELKQLNAALASAALTDSLTGLANRRALRDELERALARARRAGSLLLVAFIDLDGFKQINDRHGHDAGDLLLREAARRLQAGLRGSDYLARLGGDEFVVLGDGPELARPDAHGAAVDALRARIEALLQGPVELGPARLDGIGASVGVVVCDPHACDGRAALQAADQAMYGVKALRRAQALV